MPSPDSDATFKFKKSRATKIWAFIVVAILIALYAEISLVKQPGYNVVVLTPAETVSADIFVNGKKQGRVKSARELGNKGGVAWLELKDGKYLLELKKEERSLARKTVSIKGKALVNIEKTAVPEPPL